MFTSCAWSLLKACNEDKELELMERQEGHDGGWREYRPAEGPMGADDLFVVNLVARSPCELDFRSAQLSFGPGCSSPEQVGGTDSVIWGLKNAI